MAPTREQILQLFEGRTRPALTVRDALARLGGGRHAGKTVRRLLRNLVREGLLEKRDRRYQLRRRGDRLEGTLRASGVIDDFGERWEVAKESDAQLGDRVLLQPLDPAAGTARRGEILEVLDPQRKVWVGVIERRRSGGSITPYRDDGGRPWRLQVAPRHCGPARDGDVVVARLLPGSDTSGAVGVARVEVVEALGPPGSAEADFRAVVWRRKLRVDFPSEVEAEARAAPAEIDPRQVRRRVDLRELPLVTIDPATARDYDDAVFARLEQEDRIRLWVAIADVAHYVVRASALDREALRRGNSVYFPDRAIPMLPNRLSGDLCSLRPGIDRLAMVVEMQIDRAGAVQRRSFYPALIRSHARLAYEQAAAVMERSDAAPQLERPLVDSLNALGQLSERLRHRRFVAGSIDFDLPSAEIVLGAEGRPVDIVEAPRGVAHRAIEEAMLAANRCVAEALLAAGAPSIYRVHDSPAPADLVGLRNTLQRFGLVDRRARAVLSPKQIAAALERVGDRSEARLVHFVTLRAMAQARYSHLNRGHYALGFDAYLHFTSPIRRYADLVAHRSLKRILEADTQATTTEGEEETFERVSTRLSYRERVAVEAEREMVDLKKCAFMASRVGEVFDGSVSSVAPHGLYVTLDDVFVDGLVPLSTLPGHFHFDPHTISLVARRGGRRFRLGDVLRVRVESVNQVRAWITFSIVSGCELSYKMDSSRTSSSRARRSQSR
ncbi:MAG: ribonuclease R [Myxococcota bacterium]